MKFKNYIETESGIKDTSASPGTAGQVLSSTVTGTSWIDPDTLVSAASKLVVIACKNTSGSTINKGTPVYQTGTVGATDVIEVAPADALISSGNQPAIGLLQTTLNDQGFGNVVITGELLNFTTDPIDGVTPTTGDKVFLKSGGGLTLVKPTGAGNAIQNLGLIGKVSGGNAGSITVSSIMRANDVPNLPTGKIWVGDGNTIVSDTVYLDEVNNRMGIGTTNPRVPLQVSSSEVDTDFLIECGNTQSRMSINNTSTGDSQINFQLSNSSIFTIGVDNSDSDKFKISAGSSLGSNDRIVVDSTGNVGIGTTSPSAKLDIGGNIKFTNSATDNYITTDSNASKLRMFGGSSNSVNNGAALTLNGHTNSGEAGVADLASSPAGFVRFRTGTSENMRITSAGNVGIGLTNPVDRLDLYDSDDNVGMYFHTATSGTGGGNGLRVGQNNANAFVWNYEATPLSLATGGTARLTINATGGIRFNTGYGAGTLVTDSSGNITVSSGGGAGGPYLPLSAGSSYPLTGNLTISVPDGGGSPAMTNTLFMKGYEGRGIGMKIRDSANSATSPSNREWFVGSGYANSGFNIGYSATGSSSSYSAQSKFNITTSGVVTIPGNVGIGTTSPSTKLHIEGDGSIIRLQNNNSDVNGTFIDFRDSTGTRTGYLGTTGASDDMFLFTQASKPIRFFTNATERARITGAGNVGIGTTSPAEKLTVSGDANVTGKFAVGIAAVHPTIDFYNQGTAYFNGSTTVDDNLIVTNGNVGIGTTSPAAKLEVVGDSILDKKSILRLPDMNMGAGGITDEYLVIARKYDGVNQNATGIIGKIIFSRGGPTAGNNPSEYYINIQCAYNGDALNNLTYTGTEIFNSLDVIDISGTDYYALKVRTSGGGETANRFYAEGLLMDDGDSNMFTRVRSSDASVTVVSTGSMTPTAEVNGSGTTNYVAKWSDADTITNSVIYDNGTNVGIGTTSPGEKLTLQTLATGLGSEGVFIKNPFAGSTPIVNSKSPFLSLATSNSSGYTSTIYMGRNGTATGQESKIEWSNSNNGLSIYVAGQGSYREHVRFGNLSSSVARTYFNGTVGIGTTSPAYLLDVNEDDNVLAFRVTGGGGGAPIASFVRDVGATGSSVNINAQSNFPQIQFANTSNTFSIGGDTSGNFKISDNTAIGTNDRITIDNTGNVGIGDTSPDAKLTVFRSDSTYAINLSNTEARAGLSVKSSSSFDSKLTISSGASSRQYIQAVNNAATTGRDIVLNPYGGNVGIGTTSNGQKLSVAPDTDVSAEIGKAHIGQVGFNGYAGFSHVDQNTQQGYALIQYSDGSTYINANTGKNIRFRIANSDKMILNSSGNVGVGTTSPQDKLHVNGSQARVLIQSTAASDAVFRSLTTTGDFGSGTGIGTTSNCWNVYDYSESVERLRISNIGNVGIGTTAPSNKLDVNGIIEADKLILPTAGTNGAGTVTTPAGKLDIRSDSTWSNSAIIARTTTNQNPVLAFYRPSGSAALSYPWWLEANGSTFQIKTGSAANIGSETVSTKVTINSSGNVGIGTTSPTQRLDVNGDIAIKNATQLSFNSNNGTLSVASHAGQLDLLSSSIFINYSSNVGIGTTTPSYLLEVSGSAAKSTGTTWINTSDERTKENIQNYTKGLNDIVQLQPRVFDYNGKGSTEKSKENIGLIAQEVIDVYPEAIGTFKAKLDETDAKETDIYNLDFHSISISMINAIKELNEKVKILETKIQTLENQ